MRYIHCTLNLIKEINPKIKGKGLERPVKGLGDWYANFFVLDEKVFLIFMNEKTLYPFIVPEIYRDNIEDFHETFLNGLINSLVINGVKNKTLNKVMDEYSRVEIVRTKSQSKIASMNDHMNFFYSAFESKSKFYETVDDFNKNVVRKPLKALNFRTPLEKICELIENELAV